MRSRQRLWAALMPRLALQCLIYLSLIAVDAAALYWMGSNGLYVCAIVAVPIGFTAAWLEPRPKA